MDYPKPKSVYNTVPERALREVEKWLGKTGRFYGANGNFRALDKIPRNIGKLKGDVLHLNFTKISDISDLVNIPQLKTLKLGPDVTDISVLPKLPNLEDFEAPINSGVSDFAPLGNCSKLKRISIDVSSTKDLSFLEQSEIEHLTLFGYSGQSLPALPNLRTLVVPTCRDRSEPLDLGTLAESTLLNRVSASIPCHNLPQSLGYLKSLGIHLHNAAEFETIGTYHALEYLKVAHADISDLEPILTCKNLISLDISDASIRDVDCLRALPALRKVHLSGNPLNEISGLSYMPTLRSLDVSGTGVSDLSGWNTGLELDALDLSNTKVSDLAPLFGSNVFSLNLRNTPLADLNGVSTIRSLTRLDISGTNVAEIPKTDRGLPLFSDPTYYDPREGPQFHFDRTPLKETGFQPFPAPGSTPAVPTKHPQEPRLRRLLQKIFPGSDKP